MPSSLSIFVITILVAALFANATPGFNDALDARHHNKPCPSCSSGEIVCTDGTIKDHKTYCCSAGLTCGGGVCIPNPPCGSGETFCNDGGPSPYCCPHGFPCGGGSCGPPPVTCHNQETYCTNDFAGGPPYCCPFDKPICSFGSCSKMDACRNECNRDIRLGLKCSCQNPHCV